MPAQEAERMPKRERLELVKPILREHQALRIDDNRITSEQPEPARQRWSWCYRVLGEQGLHSRGLLGQARQEIEAEDEHGHYWSPAWADIVMVENWPIRYEVEVGYPRPIRRSRDRRSTRAQRQCITRWGARRWAKRKQRAYARYIKRLLREGLYDEYGYES